LLERQRQTIAELSRRQEVLAAQFESCVLAMQNVRFDLLRMRSAGVSEALGDLTQATQQARALSLDVDAAIGAASEIRRLIRDVPPTPT
jgi:serine/threonine-protein kinase